MAAEILERIVAATRASVDMRKHDRPEDVVMREAAARTPRPDLFLAVLERPDSINVIAECKRRSPLEGVLREQYDVVGLARAYEAAGAAAISVLTEPSFFDGLPEHLRAVRGAVAVPLLRKDFVVDRYQIAETRAAGADAVLLIAAILRLDLGVFLEWSHDAGLAALVEVHDEAELRSALDAGARIVGVNSRDLRTMTVNLDTCVELAARVPSDVVAVAESGIRTPSDIARLRAAGYSAFLVGGQLVRSSQPGQALLELTQQGSRPALTQQRSGTEPTGQRSGPQLTEPGSGSGGRGTGVSGDLFGTTPEGLGANASDGPGSKA